MITIFCPVFSYRVMMRGPCNDPNRPVRFTVAGDVKEKIFSPLFYTKEWGLRSQHIKSVGSTQEGFLNALRIVIGMELGRSYSRVCVSSLFFFRKSSLYSKKDPNIFSRFYNRLELSKIFSFAISQGT